MSVVKRLNGDLVDDNTMWVNGVEIPAEAQPELVRNAMALITKMSEVKFAKVPDMNKVAGLGTPDPVTEKKKSKKQKKAEVEALMEPGIDKGQLPGHPFVGNQHEPDPKAEEKEEQRAKVRAAAESAGAADQLPPTFKSGNIHTMSETLTTQDDTSMSEETVAKGEGMKPAPLPNDPSQPGPHSDAGDDRIMKADGADDDGDNDNDTDDDGDGDCDNCDDPTCNGTKCLDKAAAPSGGGDDVASSPPPAAPAAAPAPPAAGDSGGTAFTPEDVRSDVGTDKGLDAEVEKKGKGRKNKQGQVPPPAFDATLHSDSGDDVMPDATKAEWPLAVKRLHDASCPAYSEKLIVKTYGQTPDQIVRGTGQEVMFSALRNAVNADMGKGDYVGSIIDLSDAYSTTSLLAIASPNTLKEIRAELHKTFVEENKDALANTDALPNPKNAGQPNAGQFKRPFLAAGHYRENASGKDSGARIPDSNDVIEPGSFNRSGNVAGQERHSPGDVSKGAGARVSPPYYQNAARDQAAAAMQSLHDHIAITFPDMCVLGHPSSDSTPGATNTPANSQPVNMQARAVPTRVDQNAAKESTAVVNKVYTGDASDEEVSELDELRRQLKKAKKLNKSLQAQVDEYDSQPDPAKAPIRGVWMGSIGGPVDPEVAKQRKTDEQEYLEMLADSGNPEMRLRAADVLAKRRK